VTGTTRRREIEVRRPDLPQGRAYRARHARQMPDVLELDEIAFVERVLDRGLNPNRQLHIVSCFEDIGTLCPS
jgi:hypothetical protein